MDFSSSNSSSSSSSQYTSSAFPANSSSRPRWGELPIYESTPHFPPPPSMDNAYIALNSQENGRLAAAASSSPSFYSNYAYNYSNYNYGGGASTAGRAEEAAVKEEEGGDRPPEREHMFDKVVTPSDVGKLNRLVIPKQHAEKYFPLDSNSSEKGLLLDFEDRSGKSWRFRYSYWNSSQSYVMTKGWSRFVKEKKLDAGDVVSFQRGLGEIGKDRFYIDWRRRPDAPPPPPHHHSHLPHTIQFQHGFSLHRPFLIGPRPPPPLPPPPLVHHHHHQARDHSQLMNIAAQQRGGVISYNGLSGTATSASGYNYNYGDNYGVANPNFYHQGSVVYMRGGGGGAAAFPQQQMQMQMQMDLAGSSTSRGAHDDPSVVFDSVPVAHGGPKSAAAKRLRLFGVNMDCTVTESNVWSSSSPPSLPVNVLNSSSPEAEAGSLQLRLHGDGNASAADSTTPNSMQAIEFLDKGKSSMTLDFDI